MIFLFSKNDGKKDFRILNETKNSKSIIIRIICFILLIITVIFIFLLQMEISFTGFPDGYITDFEKSMLPFRKIAVFIYMFTSIIFFGLGIFYRKFRASNYIFFINLAITVIITIGILIVLPYYFGVCLNLDNGQGG